MRSPTFSSTAGLPLLAISQELTGALRVHMHKTLRTVAPYGWGVRVAAHAPAVMQWIRSLFYPLIPGCAPAGDPDEPSRCDMKLRRLIFCIGLSIASVGAGYGTWGVVLLSRGGSSANIGSGIAILLGGVLLVLGAAVMLSTRLFRNRSAESSLSRQRTTRE